MENKETIEIKNGVVAYELVRRKTGRVRRKAQAQFARLLRDTENISLLLCYLDSGKTSDSVYRRTELRNLRRRHLKCNGTDALAERKPNHFLKQFLKAFDPESTKRPTSEHLGDWLGIEIECFIPFENLDAYNDCTDEDTDERAYSHDLARSSLADKISFARIPGISIRGDSSIRPDEGCFPIEVTILTRRDDLSNLEKMCALLNDLDARVNKSCGLHVHLDMRDAKIVNEISGLKWDLKTISQRARRIGNALDVLLKMQPKSRRKNDFCKAAVSKYSGARYYAVNKCALREHGTIEVRLHSATTNFSKIAKWCELLTTLSQSSGLTRKKVQDIGGLIDAVPTLSDSLIEYVESRMAIFADRTAETASLADRSTDAEDRSVNQTVENENAA